MVTFKILFLSKYPVNPLYPALERLPFSGSQSSLIADRRGSAIRPAIETLQKANRSCGRGRQLRGAMNPLYPALERLPFSGFQSSLIADRRGSAIRPAVETLQKASRSCGRARMAISTVDHGFTEYLHF